MTIIQSVGAARRQLRDAGIPPDEADLDARLLAEHVLGWSAEQFLTDANTAAPMAFTARYEVLVERRARREPIAYIVHRQEFWGLDFEVSPAVLIPRPETELVVETALAILGPGREGAPACRIADVCTGSGCIAIAIARERTDAHVTATEISDAALEIARRNAVRHRVASRITFLRADLLGGVAGTFDVIAANPPYVPDVDRSSLQPEVRDYEPALALFAGRDGLHVIRRLIANAPHQLRSGGALVFEFGFGQADAVAQAVAAAPGLTLVEIRKDLQGIPRVAVARK